MVWIVFGTREASRRVPGGARVTRDCASCHEHTMFYEKERTSTFRLYFLDVFDYQRNRVMECGACGAHYATDELGANDHDLVKTIERKLERGAETIEGMAASAGKGLARFAAQLVERPDADRSDDDPAGPSELEAKFRKLEEEDDARRKRGG